LACVNYFLKIDYALEEHLHQYCKKVNEDSVLKNPKKESTSKDCLYNQYAKREFESIPERNLMIEFWLIVNQGDKDIQKTYKLLKKWFFKGKNVKRTKNLCKKYTLSELLERVNLGVENLKKRL
jgi:hypothetical protein